MQACKYSLLGLLWWVASVAADDPDVKNAEAARTGAYRLEMSFTDAAGPVIAKAAEAAIEPDELVSWEVYVPEKYDPGHVPGVLVYVSAISSGKIPRKWKPVMDEMNLIWISANQSGNKVPSRRRSIFALAAPSVIGKRYPVDTRRIYLSGASGGAKVASIVAPGTTHLFKGAVYMIGAKFFDDYPHHPIEQIQKNRFVFITGTQDSGLQSTRRTYGQYQKAGIENSKLIVVRDMGHRLPEAEVLTQGIQYLDLGQGPQSPD